jgi:DNA (cytosine-5)-methyltransferase 1
MYGLDLFSGIGGNTLGLRRYIKTFAYCENDRHAQSILLSRMSDGHIESAPIWDDVRTLSSTHFDAPIEIIVAGFPCQDTSTAGNRLGVAGSRSGLFYEVARLAGELGPEFIFLENVHGILSCGGVEVIEEVTRLGYDFRWCVLSAEDVGAYHQRKRWFGLAHRQRCGGEKITYTEHDGLFGSEIRGCFEEEVSNDAKRSDGFGQFKGSCASRMLPVESVQWDELLRGCQKAWEVEPSIPRNAHGVPYQVDRIKRLGNAVVPQQALRAFEFLYS